VNVGSLTLSAAECSNGVGALRRSAGWYKTWADLARSLDADWPSRQPATLTELVAEALATMPSDVDAFAPQLPPDLANEVFLEGPPEPMQFSP